MLLLTICPRIFAQSSNNAATLTFSDNKPRVAWLQDGVPSVAPKDASKVTGLTFELRVLTGSKEETAYVWDSTSGLIASRKVSAFKNGLWDVQDSDFDTIAAVKVSVQHNGKPISAANLELKDSARAQSQLLDLSANGTGEFFFVKPGSVQATVQYRSKTGMAAPVVQVFNLAKAAASPEPTLTISVPEDTETIGGAPPASQASGSLPQASANGPPVTGGVSGGTPATAAPAAAAPKPSESSPFGSFIVIVIALAAVLALGYFGLQYMKNNPESTRRTLEQLGAQIPKPGDEALNQGVPAVPLAAPAAPTPAPKIVLDGSAPDIYSAGSGASSAVSAAWDSGPATAFPTSVNVTGPQLRSSSGDTIPISDTLVVGRDPGLGLSLVGESSVSRRHAEIAKGATGVVLKDLGSTNGTYVNGSKLQGETVLRAGDEVRFGAVSFRFEG
jgi:hypothetical protein